MIHLFFCTEKKDIFHILSNKCVKLILRFDINKKNNILEIYLIIILMRQIIMPYHYQNLKIFFYNLII